MDDVAVLRKGNDHLPTRHLGTRNNQSLSGVTGALPPEKRGAHSPQGVRIIRHSPTSPTVPTILIQLPPLSDPSILRRLVLVVKPLNPLRVALTRIVLITPLQRKRLERAHSFLSICQLTVIGLSLDRSSCCCS